MQVLEPSRFKLARPKRFIFLCGGILEHENGTPRTAREAFLRSLDNRSKFGDFDIVLAEDINAFYPDSPYRDKNLIELETDIASLSDSVVLFSEGIGSLAELGAFTQIKSIAERMIVIIQEQYYNKKSFVRDGPIRQLEQIDKQLVLVYDWKAQNSGKPLLDIGTFEKIIDELKLGVLTKLGKLPGKSTIREDSFAHRAFLTCALVDAIGAITFEEAIEALDLLKITVSPSEMHRILFCCVAVNWLQQKPQGHTKYYLPSFHTNVCDFSYIKGAIRKDTVRWKTDLRQDWRVTDPARFKIIENSNRDQVN
jgi:hypothetical protein